MQAVPEKVQIHMFSYGWLDSQAFRMAWTANRNRWLDSQTQIMMAGQPQYGWRAMHTKKWLDSQVFMAGQPIETDGWIAKPKL